MTIVAIPYANISEATRWLQSHQHKLVEDYEFYGTVGAKLENFVFHFKNENTAMLFKLTFGGL